MKRKQIEEFPPGSALRVLADAAWRRPRFRRLAATYLGVRNPRKALELAQRVAKIERQYRMYVKLPSGYVIYYPITGTSERLVIDVGPGSHIENAIEQAIAIAAELDTEAEFDFNGVTVRLRADSDVRLVCRDWSRAMSKYIEGPVGPYPAAELTAEERANDLRIETQHEVRRRKQEQEYEAKERAKREAVEARLAGAEPMEFSEGSEAVWTEWRGKSDEYLHTGIFDYAQRWARVMQVEMAAGKELEDIAGETSHDADLEGMSGFSYGAAVATLVKCWKHGERLRRWHNAKYQLNGEGDKANEEGGVLNPALLTIG
jgi:hypothetical protein